MSIWNNPFLCKYFFTVDQPQNSSQFGPQGTHHLSPPMEIQICSFEKGLLMHLPVLWAAIRAFFARLSTLMLFSSFSKQSCHLFVSLACDCMYLYQTWNGWAATRFLKTQRISACDWLVGNGQKGSFPWETILLLSQSTAARGIAPWHLDAAAFRINCIITPPSISPWWELSDVDWSAHMHLQCALAIVQYITVAAKEMWGNISFMYDPLWIITKDYASIPSSIQEPSPS